MNEYLPSSFSITASPSGGRFDFDDGGAYCGGWQDGKAHGHGVCTGTKGLGEYSGSWHFGFEVCGVYKWPSGGVYEGRWQNGKRHGVGVEYMGKWIYKGEWTQGFKGRYGVRSSSVSAVKYEGTWAVGYQDGYGWETYADGGSYQGQWFKGMRHNYGVRSSAPYGDCSHQSGNQIQLGSTKVQSNSMQSSSFEIDDDLLASDELRPTSDRLMTSKNGFVLVAKPLDPLPAIAGRDNSDKSRRNSLIDKALGHSTSSTHSTASIFRGLRFKKQRSTSDLDAATTREASGVGQHHLDARNQHSNAGDPPDQYGESASSSAAVFALSPEELDITDPTTVETYMGEWNLDKRCGYGVCERSDKLKYEGQWSNDMKNGYGVTTHKNGIKEEGKYKNNVLIIDAKVKRYFKLRSTNLRQKIDDAVRLANQAQEVALKKADIAITRAATSRDKAEQATEAAAEAIKESRIAYSVAKQYSDPRMPFGYPMSGGGMPGNNYGAPMAYGSTFETPLKRRMSYFGHHHGGPGAKGAGSMHYSGGPHEYCGGYNENELPPDQHSQTETDPHSSRQFLRAPTAPMKPFGGRRGSFRYPGSEQAGGLSQSLASQPNINQGRHHLSSSSSVIMQTDPFNDHFEHYRSTVTAARAKTQMFRKQTSLDQSHFSSVSNQRLGTPTSVSFESDQASKTNQYNRRHSDNLADIRLDSQNQTNNNNYPMSDIDQASNQTLTRLVTSGEDLMPGNTNNSTPRPSSSNYAASGSRDTPTSVSPDLSSILRSPSQQQSQQYMPQRLPNHNSDMSASYFVPPHSIGNHVPMRAARVLARQKTSDSFGSPHALRRRARRTASLSRATSRSASVEPNGSQLTKTSLQTGSMTGSTIMAGQLSSMNTRNNSRDSQSSLAFMLANTHDGSQSNMCNLSRKPSLQVHYDPDSIGPIMSREEVAALSHAQREQRRLETELNERRARNPLFYLFLSTKEMILQRKMVVACLIFNSLLIYWFADLLSG